MTMMSNLPRDLLEEILSRAPADSMRAIRLTCKKWNTLAEEESFRKKQLLLAKAAKEFMVVMLMNSMVCLVSINLHKEDDVIKCNGKLIKLTDVSQVFHCGGLVCITNGFTNTRDVLWNPYWGQTRWIEARSRHAYIYAIGYETKKSCRSYKIVSSANYYIGDKRVDYEMYELDSNSWRVLDLNSDWATAFYKMEVSVKGNSYTYTRAGGRGEFLICFDFTTEGFRPALPLPFHSHRQDIVALSSVREEQLAVLCQRYDTLHMEIWITSKIEPNDVSWRKLLLAVDMKPLTVCYGNFFVDEEKKVAVVFDKDKEIRHRNTAYIIGENGYLRKVDLGESAPFLVGCSYVPSSVQIKQLSKGKSN
ncbi:F-box associated interaction domain [Arabidopsis suecica]|uniref:F-box associated interaction domain n=1 Tax=Arabidopsis suecica TaxID=45249 RepID=A0A8T2B809_ARASU|nr:F-box associated interaction domain [Arabidopsis suecica]